MSTEEKKIRKDKDAEKKKRAEVALFKFATSSSGRYYDPSVYFQSTRG